MGPSPHQRPLIIHAPFPSLVPTRLVRRLRLRQLPARYLHPHQIDSSGASLEARTADRVPSRTQMPKRRNNTSVVNQSRIQPCNIPTPMGTDHSQAVEARAQNMAECYNHPIMRLLRDPQLRVPWSLRLRIVHGLCPPCTSLCRPHHRLIKACVRCNPRLPCRTT